MSGSGVFLSTNYGMTWTAVDSGLTSTDIRSFAVSPNGTGATNVFAGSYEGDVFLSSNNGTSWRVLNTGLSGSNVSSLAVIGANLFKGTQSGVYLSTDNGTSWTAITSGLPSNSEVSSLVVTPNGTGGSNLFAGTRTSGVFLSTNNGTSWIAVDSGLTSTDVRSLAVSPNGVGGTNLFAGTYGSGVFLSTNDGRTWTPTDLDLTSDLTSTNVCALVEGPNGLGGTNLFAGTDDNVLLPPTGRNGVFLSTNNGTSWTATGMTNTAVGALAVSPNGTGGTNLFAGALRGGVFISTNNGASWDAVNVGFPRASYDSAAYPPVTAFNVSPNRAGGTNLFAGTGGSGVFLSTNNGASWGAVNAGLPRNPFDTAAYTIVAAFAAIPDGTGGTNLFAGTGLTDFGGHPHGGVFLSTNNGTSWTPAGLTNTFVHAFAVSPNGRGGTNLFAGSSAGVFLSTNNGTSWTADSAGLDRSEVFALALSPNGVGGTNIFAGTTYGVFISTINGTSWTPRNEGLSDYFNVFGWITAFAVIPDGPGAPKLIAATNVNGVWRRPLSEMITSARLSSGEIPAQFTLKQNYPNPFNPSTTIQFSVPRAAHVVLRVFNTIGQEVTTLASEELVAGTYTRQWNAARSASGVYFYRLQAGGYTETKKLLLVR